MLWRLGFVWRWWLVRRRMRRFIKAMTAHMVAVAAMAKAMRAWENAYVQVRDVNKEGHTQQ